LVTFGLESNFNTYAIRSKIPKESREKNLKEDLQKKEVFSIKEKIEMLYEKVLDDLLVN